MHINLKIGRNIVCYVPKIGVTQIKNMYEKGGDWTGIHQRA